LHYAIIRSHHFVVHINSLMQICPAAAQCLLVPTRSKK
jgi:hypothetical protein